MTNASSYIIELDRWNIRNDGTDAVATSQGINDALAWASKQNIAEVVLPRGTYLIDENNPIQPQSHMTFNLGGATLRIRDNGLQGYAIVSFREKQYARLTNGKIEGDRYTHDYSSGSTHEFGIGVDIRYGNEYITVDNLEIYNTTGDAIIAITSYGGIGGSFPNLSGNLEAGGINLSNGSLTTSSNRIRSSVNIPLIPQIKNSGYFGIYGDSYGGIGNEITTDMYDVVFYRDDGRFVKSETNLHFFDEVPVPPDADYARVVLHQGTVPSSSGIRALIRTPQFPKHIYIEKCLMHHCRRLGVAICGVKHFYVKGCEIHHISGTAPAGAIDVEDGYDLNQHIYIEGNNIYDSRINVIAVAGRYITVKKNKIRTGIFSMSAGVNKAIVESNHFIDADPRLVGETIFANNHLYNSQLMLLGESYANVNNCYFHNSTLKISKEKEYTAQIDHCKLYLDDDFYNSSINPGAPINFSIQPQIFSNSIIEGSGLEALTAVPNETKNWIFNNVSFINTKHRNNRKTTLPPGVYKGCNFQNSGSLQTTSNPSAILEFDSCTFNWDSYDLFYIRSILSLLKFQNSNFVGGKEGIAIFLWTMQGRVELINNDFDYPNSFSKNEIIKLWPNTFTANYVLVDSNRFNSNMPMTAIRASNILSTIPLIFRNNIINKVTVDINSHHQSQNNIVL